MSESIKPVAVINKATDILECLIKYPNGISLGDISQAVNINKSTVYRILHTLMQSTYVMQDPVTGLYKLGGRFLLYSSFISNFDKKALILPYMKEYSDETGFSTNLAVLENDFSLTILSYAPNTNSSIKLMAETGFKSELYRIATGKIFLSSFSEEKLEKYLETHQLVSVTQNTITDKDVLREDLLLTQKRGYSIERMENEEKIIALAVPVKNYTGEVVAALANMALSQYVNDSDIPVLGEQLKETGEKISEILGEKRII